MGLKGERKSNDCLEGTKIAVDKISELEYNSAEEETTEIPGRLCPM